LIGSIG
jgi:SAM-dependent methyltransferase